MVWEAISKTRKSVSSGIQTPRSRSKKLGCASFFQPTSRCLDILMKHSFSCLIYYMNLPRSKSESIRPLFLPSLFAFLCDFFLSVLQIDYPVSRIDHTTDDWSRIDSNRVDSTTFSTLPVRKKSHKKANREGRKSGQIDSIRVDSTRIVRCVVDSTNWIVDLRDT